jgi:hypothetical protein
MTDPSIAPRAATRDPGLRQRVQRLLASEDELRNLGILGPARIRMVQDRAAAALARVALR